MHLFTKKPMNDVWKMAGGTLFGLLLSIGFLQLDNPAMLKVQSLQNTMATTVEATKNTEEKKLLWEAMTFETLDRLTSFFEEERKFDYPLAQNQKGTKSFVIPQNACRNGVRLEAKADTGRTTNFDGNLQVVGVDSRISRTVLNVPVDFSSQEAFRVIHVPTSFDYRAEDGTVFPKYSILPGKNAEKITYDVWCY
jgi:hypothetical protein